MYIFMNLSSWLNLSSRFLPRLSGSILWGRSPYSFPLVSPWPPQEPLSPGLWFDNRVLRANTITCSSCQWGGVVLTVTACPAGGKLRAFLVKSKFRLEARCLESTETACCVPGALAHFPLSYLWAPLCFVLTQCWNLHGSLRERESISTVSREEICPSLSSEDRPVARSPSSTDRGMRHGWRMCASAQRLGHGLRTSGPLCSAGF